MPTPHTLLSLTTLHLSFLRMSAFLSLQSALLADSRSAGHVRELAGATLTAYFLSFLGQSAPIPIAGTQCLHNNLSRYT